MKFPSYPKLLSAALALPFIFACSSPTDASRRTVSLNLRATTAPASNVAASSTLQLSSLRLLVKEASLGSGDQFGCQDCEGGAEGIETGAVGAVVSVPLDGSAVNLATEQVQPGSYAEVEIGLGGATTPDGWTTGQTVEIQGRNNGTPFTIRVAVNGSFRETLSPPVDVPPNAASSSIAVVITLPVASWFTAGGQALDPAVPAQLAQIEANIKAAFSGPESGVKSGGNEG